MLLGTAAVDRCYILTDLWYQKMEKAWCHHAAEIVRGAEADEGSQPDSEKVEMAKRAVSELGTLDVPVPEHGSTPIYDDEPTNTRELEAHPEKEAILKSSALEIDQMIGMDVGILISPTEEKKLLSNRETILRSKMIIKRKYAQVNGREQFLKWKSRLAIMGNTQEAGFDTVWSTFSPTIGFTAIRTMIALLCDPKYSVESYDLSGAFLGTKLENQAIYVRLPANIGEYSNRVLRLTRLVYGLKNSGSGFMKQLAEEILKFQERVEVETEQDDKGKTTKQRRVVMTGFVRLRSDLCMFRYEDELGREMYFLSYVDDIIFASSDPGLRDRFFEHLSKTWKVTREGVLDRFLAVNFTRSADGWSWEACLKSYIEKIAKRFDLTESRPVKTPLEPGFALTESDFDQEPTEEMKSELRSLIGSIGYATTALRYDAAYAVSILSRHLVRPCSKVIAGARRVIVYLYHSRDFTIKWSSSRAEQCAGTTNILFGSVDASFAMDEATRRSHGGFINFVNHGAVSWKSGLQQIVTLSSCEAEYIALCSEVCEVMYLRNLMRELGFMQEESTLIWEDNRAAIALAENEVSSAGRSKHIDLRFRFVAEAVKDGIVRVRYTPTDTNHADLFTKSLTTATFERLLKMAVGLKGITGSQGYTDVHVIVDSELFMLLGV